jgi:hypothetical protein
MIVTKYVTQTPYEELCVPQSLGGSNTKQNSNPFCLSAQWTRISIVTSLESSCVSYLACQNSILWKINSSHICKKDFKVVRPLIFCQR